jgi:subtilisin family serine protease
VRRLALTAIALLLAACVLSAARADVASDSLVHVDAAHAAGYTGQGATIAILDTGIDGRNAELSRRVVAEHCFVPPNGCPDGSAEQDGAGSAQDDQGHGTEIASVVADTAPDASLVIVKVADANGRSSATQIAAALDWVRTSHPEAKVVNVSLVGDIPLSGDCSQLTPSLQVYAGTVDALRANGTSVFAAAGNGGRTNGLPPPACFPSSVAVGAVYARSVGSFTAPDVCVDRVTAADQLACFSNTSGQLDLLAAGLPIATTGLGGVETSISGTSAASAQAAGVAALLLQADPGLAPASLLALLRDTGTPVPDTRSHVLEPFIPRVDAAAALGRVTGHPIPLLPPFLPRLVVAGRPIAFGRVRANHAVTRTVVVRNEGQSTLTVRASSSSSAVRTAPPRLLVGGTPGTLSVVFRPKRPGRYRGELKLVTDDPARRVVRISFSGVAAG